MLAKRLERMEPTDDQIAVAEELDRFLSGSSNAFVLKGYAGTGKTFMIGALVQYLADRKTPFYLMAPTGRAAKVLAERTGFEAATIHRTIYEMSRLQEYKEPGEDGSETFKYYFGLKANEHDAHTVYIVDEASMVSDSYSEAEFFRFGSGHLLKDLLYFVNLDHNDHRRKVILVGDPAQLPPVNSPDSPALIEDVLERKYSLRVRSATMRDVVRQRADSGILANASALRDGIEAGSYNRLEIRRAPDVEIRRQEEALDLFMQARDRQGPDQVLIVAWSNRRVKGYNEQVRERLFPGRAAIATGDRILVVRNNYRHSIPLFNGDFGAVVEASDEVDRETVFLNKPHDGKRVNVRVDLAFRRVRLRFEDPEQGFVDIRGLISETLLNSPDPTLSSDQHKALYVDFKNRHPHLRAGTKEFREVLLADERFNCIQVKYGYAVTCHKAQGGEWSRVFVDFESGIRKTTQEYFRWAYTAVTRAKGRLDCLNAPRFSRVTAARPVVNTSAFSRAVVRHEAVPPAPSGPAAPFPIPPEAPWLGDVFRTVEQAVLPLGIHIEALRHRAYAQDYALAEDGHKAMLHVHYNKERKITAVLFHPKSAVEIVQRLAALRGELEGRRFMVAPAQPAETPGAQESPILAGNGELRAFHEELVAATAAPDIAIESFDYPSPYHGRYTFARRSERAFVNYYFNQAARLTRVLPDAARTNSCGLLEDVLNISQPEEVYS